MRDYHWWLVRQLAIRKTKDKKERPFDSLEKQQNDERERPFSYLEGQVDIGKVWWRWKDSKLCLYFKTKRKYQRNGLEPFCWKRIVRESHPVTKLPPRLHVHFASRNFTSVPNYRRQMTNWRLQLKYVWVLETQRQQTKKELETQKHISLLNIRRSHLPSRSNTTGLSNQFLNNLHYFQMVDWGLNIKMLTFIYKTYP